jgi:hypothetical protein
MAFSAVVVALQMRTALVAALTTAFNDPTVSVSLGTSDVSVDVVGASMDAALIGEVSFVMDDGPMGAQRSMNEHMTCDVLIRVDKAGGDQAAELAAVQRLGDLIDKFESYLRTVDPYLGGIVQRAWVSAGTADTIGWYADDNDSPHHRTAELILTVSAWQRIQIPA